MVQTDDFDEIKPEIDVRAKTAQSVKELTPSLPESRASHHHQPIILLNSEQHVDCELAQITNALFLSTS